MFKPLSHPRFLPALILGIALGPAVAAAAPDTRPATRPTEGAEGVVRGADELYWVPTLEQALEMSKATGRPIFLMGYSLVGDGSTYTKVGADYCTGVY